MQLMTHFPLVNIRYPINAAIWYSALYQLATFDIVDTDELSEVILRKVGEANQSEDKFDAEATLSDSTIEAGFEDADVINGSLLQILFYGLGITVGLLLSITLLLVWRFKKV